MAKKKREEAHGGHGWFVTFADLMALLLAFFVMLVAFSSQDKDKLKIVAGSMREAFGVQTEARFSGIIESDGLPTRAKLKNAAFAEPAAKARAAQANKHLFIRISLLVAELEQLRNHDIAGRP